jgi:hypothetical protein
MKKTCFKILFSLVLLYLSEVSYAQEKDSLIKINEEYEALLKSDEDALNVLFYKQEKNVPISNLGPYGSPYYYPSTSYLYKKNIKIG